MKSETLTPQPAYAKTAYHTAAVHGLDIFYREAGTPDRPTVLLLHGFPTSSHMFRELIPALAADYHVIAPDYPGFGQSSAPDADKFDYTFDHLAEVMEAFLQQIGCTRFSMFMQDYGSPIGFRIAAKHPEWVSALLVQNANAYVEGINMEAFAPVQPFWASRTAETEAPVRSFLAAGTTKFQYTHGARNPAAISPDNWQHDQPLLDRPGNDRVQLALLHDYQNNVPCYAEWQAYLRRHQPPTLITWGKNDPFFTEAGARAFLRDLPQAELHLLDTGHFALEEDGPLIATLNRADFVNGREEVVAFLRRKWAKEHDYRLRKTLWAFTGNRIAVRFEYEWHDETGQWWRSHGNENWEFDADGYMAKRYASINDQPIAETNRKFRWERPA
jgi:nuclear transport factor 2 (NTF2) superfamily protein/alpha-beta hydrolase superfamily lysophospholipase